MRSFALLLILTAVFSDGTDLVGGSDLGYISRDSDGNKVLYLAAVFPTEETHGRQELGKVSFLSAVSLALEDINHRKDLLSGYKLHLHYWNNTECIEPGDLPRKVMLLAKCNTGCATNTAAVADLWNLLVMCYGAVEPVDNEKNKFPALLRMQPSFTAQNMAIINLMKRYELSTVVILNDGEDTSITVAKDLEDRCKRADIEFTTETFHTDMQNFKSNHDKTHVIVGLFQVETARKVLCEIYKQQLYGDSYVWFFSGQYEDDWFERNLEDEEISCTQEQMREAAEGHLTTEILLWNPSNRRTISGMTADDFLTRMKHSLRESGHDVYNNNFQEDYVSAPLVYDAIWALALALNKTMTQLQDKGQHLEDFYNTDTDAYKKIYSTVIDTEFAGVSAERFAFDSKGNRVATVQIEKMVDGRYFLVGYYDTYNSDVTIMEEERWFGAHNRESTVSAVPLGLYSIGTMALLGIVWTAVLIIV